MEIRLVPHVLVAACLGEIRQLFRLFELCVPIPASYICIVTNNHTIMKKNKPSLDPLYLDAADYIFVEWLVRSNYYSRFKDNFIRNNPDYDNAREGIRSCLSMLFRSRTLSFRDAVSASFLFTRTPEGEDFWYSVDREWRAFLRNLNFNF